MGVVVIVLIAWFGLGAALVAAVNVVIHAHRRSLDTTELGSQPEQRQDQ